MRRLVYWAHCELELVGLEKIVITALIAFVAGRATKRLDRRQERNDAEASRAPTEEARLLLQGKAPGSGIPPETISGTRTYAHTDARPAGGRFPLVLLTRGLTLPRASLTGLADELVIRGYVVALVDHTYESTGTTLPNGQTLTCAIRDQPRGRDRGHSPKPSHGHVLCDQSIDRSPSGIARTPT